MKWNLQCKRDALFCVLNIFVFLCVTGCDRCCNVTLPMCIAGTARLWCPICSAAPFRGSQFTLISQWLPGCLTSSSVPPGSLISAPTLVCFTNQSSQKAEDHSWPSADVTSTVRYSSVMHWYHSRGCTVCIWGFLIKLYVCVVFFFFFLLFMFYDCVWNWKCYIVEM